MIVKSHKSIHSDGCYCQKKIHIENTTSSLKYGIVNVLPTVDQQYIPVHFQNPVKLKTIKIHNEADDGETSSNWSSSNTRRYACRFLTILCSPLGVLKCVRRRYFVFDVVVPILENLLKGNTACKWNWNITEKGVLWVFISVKFNSRNRDAK